MNEINYYLVGGYVRDKILGVRSKDIDFAVEAPSFEALRNDLLAKNVLIWQERPEFLTIRGRHPELGAVDYTLCRKDGFYSDNRHPDTVEIGSIYDDLARRDFTINAIAIDERTNEYLDPHKGTQDIADRVLRTVGDPRDRFKEDPLRMLRAIRFYVTRDFEISGDVDILFFSRVLLDMLGRIPIERVYEELRKCFEANSWETLVFFDRHSALKDLIFNQMNLQLVPKIPEI